MKLTIPLLFLLASAMVSCQTTTQHEIVFQCITNNLLTDSFRTRTLTITEKGSVRIYAYADKRHSTKYEVKKKPPHKLRLTKDGESSEHYKFYLHNEVTENSEELGSIKRIRGASYWHGRAMPDSGSGGYFSMKYGIICFIGYQTRSGEIIYSIDGKQIKNRQQRSWYFR